MGGVVASTVAETAIATAVTAGEIAAAATDAIAAAIVAGGEALESAIPGLISQIIEASAAQAGSAVGSAIAETVDSVAGTIVGTMIDTIGQVGVEGAINLAVDGLSTGIENIAEEGLIDFITSMTDKIAQKVAKDAVEAAMKKAIKKSISKLGTEYLKNLVVKESDDIDPTLGSLVDIFNSGTSTDLNDWIVRGKDIRDIVTKAHTQLVITTANNIETGSPPTFTAGNYYVFAHTYNTPTPTLSSLSTENRYMTLLRGSSVTQWTFVAVPDDPYSWQITSLSRTSKPGVTPVVYETEYLHSTDETLQWLNSSANNSLSTVDKLRSVWRISRSGPLGYSIKNESTYRYLYYTHSFDTFTGMDKGVMNLCNKKQLNSDVFQEFVIYKTSDARAMRHHNNLHIDAMSVTLAENTDMTVKVSEGLGVFNIPATKITEYFGINYFTVGKGFITYLLLGNKDIWVIYNTEYPFTVNTNTILGAVQRYVPNPPSTAKYSWYYYKDASVLQTLLKQYKIIKIHTAYTNSIELVPSNTNYKSVNGLLDISSLVSNNLEFIITN